MNDNSSIIALMIKFGLPNGIPIRPIKIIENKITNTWFFGCKLSILSSYTLPVLNLLNLIVIPFNTKYVMKTSYPIQFCY